MDKKLVDALKTSEVMVRFRKADGSVRVMRCTLQPDVIPPVRGTGRAKNEDVASVWDLDTEDWRSFRFDSVMEWIPLVRGAQAVDLEGRFYVCSGQGNEVVVRWRHGDLDMEMGDDGWTICVTKPSNGVSVLAGPLFEGESLAMFPTDFADLDIPLQMLYELTHSSMLALAVRRAAVKSSKHAMAHELRASA